MLATAVVVLSGCTLGQPGSFTGRAESDCRQTSAEISGLARPTTASDTLAYALDRYSDVERLVSEISSDIAFPGGGRGAALRTGWLQPSRRSLRAGLIDLAALRAAIRSGDSAEMTRSYSAALAAGTSGVDAAILRAQGLPGCASAFTATAADAP